MTLLQFKTSILEVRQEILNYQNQFMIWPGGLSSQDLKQ